MSGTATNKVKYNLKNVHVAVLTETVSEGETTYSYGTPHAIPGAVSLSLSAEGDSSPFYADGMVYFRTNTNNGYSGDLELAYVSDWVRKNLLGETEDTNKVLFENSNNTSIVHFALLFEFDGDAKAIRHVMYNCSVSRPEVSSETKKDTYEPKTETLSLKVDPRSDGMVKARTGDETTSSTYNGWYNTVYEQVSGS